MLNKQFESTLKDAAFKLTGFKKRAFMAQVTQDYFQSSLPKSGKSIRMVKTSYRYWIKRIRNRNHLVLTIIEQEGEKKPKKSW